MSFAAQAALMQSPKSGDVIRGGGGLRKLRWLAQGRGKRGGARVIYYFQDAKSSDLLDLRLCKKRA